jgi:MOSC domain-containing protein YiiM
VALEEDNVSEKKRHPGIEQLLSFFVWEHLPEHLQKVSKPFGELAHQLVEDTPESPELTVCLRKLLEAKDCAVRAQLSPPKSKA